MTDAPHAGPPPVPPAVERPPGATSLQPAPQTYGEPVPMAFTGTEQEFARIWFVNLALTILTLGIYAAWGKVRTRRYLYGHTRLGGEGFEYHAKPLALLKGYLISGAFFAAYALAGNSYPVLSAVLLLIGAGLMPWVLWLSLRFNAQNTGYLGLRLRFRGSLQRSYRVNLWGALAAGLSFGIMIPLFQHRRRRYAWSGLSFGDQPVLFGASAKCFYTAGALASVWFLLGFLGIGFLVNAFEEAGLISVNDQGEWVDRDAGSSDLLLAAIAPIALVALALGQAAWTAGTHNAVFRKLGVGPDVAFDARLSTFRLMWRYLQNNFLLLVTLGLAYPWTRVATWRLLVESISVRGVENLARAAAAPPDAISALGDAASSAFDLDLGL